MTEYKFYNSPWKAVKLILMCSVFVVGGIWMLNLDGAPLWVAWMSIGFFGLGYPVGIYQLLDRRPQVVVNEMGIYAKSTGQETINWELIKNAYIASIHGQKFICLQIDEAYEPSNKKGKLYKIMANLNKDLGFQELNIALGQIKVDEDKLAMFIMAMTTATPSERQQKINTIAQDIA